MIIGRPQPALHALPSRIPPFVSAPDASDGSARLSAQPAKILIVEDDFLVATEIESALTRAGFEVPGIAASAEEAINLVLQHDPVLAVMDIHLATRRDGIDTALELLRDHNIRCIFATAHYDTEIRRRAEPALPLGWIGKPYSMNSLVALVEQAVTQLAGGRHAR